jgi:hypothetical protein
VDSEAGAVRRLVDPAKAAVIALELGEGGEYWQTAHAAGDQRLDIGAFPSAVQSRRAGHRVAAKRMNAATTSSVSLALASVASFRGFRHHSLATVPIVVVASGS